jgi:hypothetical protein
MWLSGRHLDDEGTAPSITPSLRTLHDLPFMPFARWMHASIFFDNTHHKMCLGLNATDPFSVDSDREKTNPKY